MVDIRLDTATVQLIREYLDALSKYSETEQQEIHSKGVKNEYDDEEL